MIDALTTLLSSPMMQRSLLAALIVGLTAPIIGTYLVHRRLAMLGDGIGHISLTGVALGWLAGAFANVSPADSWAIPGAVIISLLGAIAIELVRQSGRTSGDTALAMLFYGGIAGGVLLIGLAGGTSAQLNSYLFGSISTVRWSDITLITILGAAIVILGVGLAPALFSVTNDEDFARSTGLPVRTLSLLIAILSALTVAVAMRVVGSLLVSALMVIPVAIAQLGARSFRSTMGIAMVLGVLICICGLSLTYFVDLSPDDRCGRYRPLRDRVYDQGGPGSHTQGTQAARCTRPQPAPRAVGDPVRHHKEGRSMQRMTKQRQAVLDELTRVADFRSAQQIFEDLHSQGQRVGLATVYRSLQGLAEDGRVDTLRSTEGETLYRNCASEHHHHHLVCRKCGFTEEIEQSQIESWVMSVAMTHGFADVEHSLELFGVCTQCQMKAAES